MTEQKQPEALWLAVSSSAMADEGEMIHLLSWHEIRNLLRADATELRRLHAECETLRTGYAAARLEIESLRARSAEPVGEYPALPEPAFKLRWDSKSARYTVSKPNIGDTDVLTADQMRAHGEACWKAGYKHGAWVDAKPVGTQQPGAAYAATALAQLRHIYTNLKNGGVRDTAQAKRIADGLLGPVIESLERAQAAPAAVMVPHEQMTEEIDNVLSDPDTQLSPGAERALRWLRTWTDATLVLSAAPTTQPAPQQEAQEPVAWYVTGCGRLLDEDEAKAEARHIGGTARAIPLYTAPQPSPASQGDENA